MACRIVEAVRKAVGDEIDLMLEFHGRFSPIMALEAIRAMVPYRPRWCEEPIPAHNHEVHGTGCRRISAARGHR